MRWGQRPRIETLALAGAAVALSLVGTQWLVPYTTGNNDEAVFLFQAELYRDGQVTLPGDLADAFRPWMSGVRDGERIMVFPPGWPAVLALGRTLVGSYVVLLALVMAALALASRWMVREVTGDERAARIGAWAFVASPLFVIHSGSFLSYLPALLCEMVAVAAVRCTERTGRRRVAAVGGVAIGVLFAMRPLDAVLVTVLLAVYSLRPRDGRWRDVGRLVSGSLLGVTGPVLATFAYNTRVSGNPFVFPIGASGGDNAFGTGPRHIAEGTPVVDVTFRMLAEATWRSVAEVPQWLPGAWLALPLVAWGVLLLWRRDRATTLLLAAIVVVVPLVYFFYWGTVLMARGREYQGPFYFAPLWIPATVLVGVAGARLVERRSESRFALPVLVVGAGVLALWSPVDHYLEYRAGVDREIAAMRQVPDDSVVVLPIDQDGAWILKPRAHFANAPDLDGDLAFAADTGATLIDDLEQVPGRRRFAMRFHLSPGEDPLRPIPLVVELTTLDGRMILAEQHLDGAGRHLAFAATDRRSLQCVAANRTVRWIIAGGDIVGARGCADAPLETPLPSSSAAGSLVVGHLTIDADDAVIDGFEQRFSIDSSAERTTVLSPGRCRRRLVTDEGASVWFTDDRPEEAPVALRAVTSMAVAMQE